MTRVAARTLLLVTLGLVPIAIALGVTADRRELVLPAGRESMLVLELITTAAALLYVTVGYLIVRRRPDNPIGWIFLGAAPLFALVGVAYGYADLSLYGGEGWPLDRWAAWVANWMFTVPVFAVPVLIAQLFPDGRPVSRRWGWIFKATIVAFAGAVFVRMFSAAALDPYPDVENPAALPGALGEILDDAWVGGGIVVQPLTFLAALGSLIARFRRARAVERQQLKWLAFAGAVLLVGFVGAGVAGDGVVSDAFFIVAIAALVFLPIAVALAILRYRLYDIDRVISKTLVYGALTVVLGAAYLGLVLVGQALTASVAGGSDLAIAASTLVVAALFLPLRSRVQRFVDRRFYRRRYDAQRTLEGFGARLREQIDLGALESDLQGVVSETMQPASASLWLRKGNP